MKIVQFANATSEYLVLLDDDDEYYDEPEEYLIPEQGYVLFGSMEFDDPDVSFGAAGLPTSVTLHKQ